MSTPQYRLTVIGCAFAWFMLGLHVPVLHEMTHHGRAPRWDLLLVTLLIAGAAVAGLWALLRTRVPGPSRPDAVRR